MTYADTMSYAPYRKAPSPELKAWLPPVLISAFLWWTTPNVVTFREWGMCALLLIFPWVSYYRWQRSGESRAPVYAIIALAYWAAFAMPVFLANPPSDPQFAIPFDEPTVFAVLGMAVLGMAALGVGMRLPFRPINAKLLPDIESTEKARRYLYFVVGLGTLLSIDIDNWALALGSGGHQVIDILGSAVPFAICAMLAIKFVEGTATKLDRYALYIVVSLRLISGIASGWLGAVISLGMMLMLIHVSKHRKLPSKAILTIIPVILFLQVGKADFREVYWKDGANAGVVEKAEFWVTASYKQWSSVFEHNDRKGGHALFSKSVDRIALLPQAANVIAKSPRVVPFQNGATYPFLAATLIPRAVWPDKPNVNEANRFYQVAYGLTAKDDLDGVSISVGILTESYMNFGWRGVAPIMFLLGLILGVYEKTLLHRDSGLVFNGIGMALLISLLNVEGQAAQYLGGLPQQIGVLFLVMVPFVRRRKVQHPQSFHHLQEAT